MSYKEESLIEGEIENLEEGWDEVGDYEWPSSHIHEIIASNLIDWDKLNEAGE